MYTTDTNRQELLDTATMAAPKSVYAGRFADFSRGVGHYSVKILNFWRRVEFQRVPKCLDIDLVQKDPIVT